MTLDRLTVKARCTPEQVADAIGDLIVTGWLAHLDGNDFAFLYDGQTRQAVG